MLAEGGWRWTARGTLRSITAGVGSDPLCAECQDALGGAGGADRGLDPGVWLHQSGACGWGERDHPRAWPGDGGALAGVGTGAVIELAHLSESQKRAYILADNRLAEQAGWDRDLLALELGDLRDLEVDLMSLGFEPGSWMRCSRRAGRPAGGGGAGPAGGPGVAEGRSVGAGDPPAGLRDATDAATVARVLGGVRPHLMVSDPPYGVAYDPAWRNEAGRGPDKAEGKVLNDHRRTGARPGRSFPATWPMSGTGHCTRPRGREPDGHGLRDPGRRSSGPRSGWC